MRPWGRRIRTSCSVLALLVLAGLTGVPRVSSAPDPDDGRVHPYLAKLAAQSPDSMVNVLVAKQRGADERAIEKGSGGKRLKSWSFINAMEIRVPARAVSGLAHMPGVKFVTPDSPMHATGTFDDTQTAANFQAALNIQPFWTNQNTGAGIGVAVIDTGVAPHPDLASHTVNVVLPSVGSSADTFGHGTHVAGIIAGNAGDGQHVGVAPGATIYNLRVTGNDGNAVESDMISALQWVYQNHATYNIRVVNISMQSSIAESYTTSPLAAAAEQAWMAGVVVVVSAGNQGGVDQAMWYPPANDPFVITVGAYDDNDTKDPSDDLAVSWSSTGLTQEGLAKPEILAPGRRILAPLASGSTLAQEFPAQVDGVYIRLSGSSMASPTIAGLAALMLSDQPSLTPNQVKYALMNNLRSPVAGQASGNGVAPDAGQIFDSIQNPGSVPEANLGVAPSRYLEAATGTISSTYYDNVYFNNVYFNNVYFNNVLSVPNVYGQ